MKSLKNHGFARAISTCSTRARHKYIPVMEQPLKKIVTTIATLRSRDDVQIANEFKTAFGGRV